MCRSGEAPTPFREGARLGAYEILDRLGAGGMGEVWLARDTRLGRKVAVKTLLAEFADHLPRLRRFEEEARTVAALNHPNIVTLHSVELEGGVRFLTMEYVEGTTLDALIPEAGQELGQFFDLALPLTEAVAVAHRRGIAHRDLKPGNIMVTEDGRVKVVDFGLATAAGLEEAEAASRAATGTQEGAIVGTVPYMAPEQLRGSRADCCSDVFSLGVVLYQMIAGRRPFGGSTFADLASSILRDEPMPLDELRADLPDGLAAALGRCLEKDPARRPATADALLPELAQAREAFASRRLGGAVTRRRLPRSGQRRVAVLEFANIASDSEVDWIAAGMAETVTVDLKKVPELKVISPQRVAKAAREAGDLDEVELGRRLEADTVVAGAIQRAGQTLRVTVRHVDVAEGALVESFRVDGSLDGIFEMQDRVVGGLLERFGAARAATRDEPPPTVRLPESARSGVSAAAAAPTGKLEAFECFARARRLVNRMSAAAFGEARDLLARAVEIDPSYAMAHAGLGQALGMSYIASTDPRDLEAAIGHLTRAVELDPQSAAPCPWLSYCLMRADRLAEAVAAGRRGIQLDPDDSLGHYMLAVSLWVRANREPGSDSWDEVFEHFAAAARLAPRYQAAGQLLGAALLYRGRYEDARGPLERAAEVEASDDFELSRFVGAHLVLGRLEYLEGDLDAAGRMARRSLELISNRDHVYTAAMVALSHGLLADVLCRRGRPEDALTELRTAVEWCLSRSESLGIGAILVRTHLALARCFQHLRMGAESRALYEEATDLFRRRSGYDFSWTIEVSEGDLYREMALYHAVAGHPDEAVAALRQAVECGWSDRRLLATEPGFAAVRAHPEFARLVAVASRASPPSS